MRFGTVQIAEQSLRGSTTLRYGGCVAIEKDREESSCSAGSQQKGERDANRDNFMNIRKRSSRRATTQDGRARARRDDGGAEESNIYYSHFSQNVPETYK